MSQSEAKYTIDDVDVQKDEVVYDGFFKMHALTLKHKLFGGGWSNTIRREVFHRGEACAAVLYDPERDLIALVEQFRIGALVSGALVSGALEPGELEPGELESEHSPWCLEVVAGMIEEGESPEGVIRRELQEEAGVTEAELIPITRYYSTPGGCSELIHLYCALCDLSEVGGIHGLEDETEDILVQVFQADEIFAVMLDSRMNNAATLLGLQWLQINRKSLEKCAKTSG